MSTVTFMADGPFDGGGEGGRPPGGATAGTQTGEDKGRARGDPRGGRGREGESVRGAAPGNQEAGVNPRGRRTGPVLPESGSHSSPSRMRGARIRRASSGSASLMSLRATK